MSLKWRSLLVSSQITLYDSLSFGNFWPRGNSSAAIKPWVPALYLVIPPHPHLFPLQTIPPWNNSSSLLVTSISYWGPDLIEHKTHHLTQEWYFETAQESPTQLYWKKLYRKLRLEYRPWDFACESLTDMTLCNFPLGRGVFLEAHDLYLVGIFLEL